MSTTKCPVVHDAAKLVRRQWPCNPLPTWILLSLMLATGCGSRQDGAANQPPANRTPSAEDGESIGAQSPSESTEVLQPKAEEASPAASAALATHVPFELLTTVEAGILSIKAVAFAPDGKTFVTGGGTPKIWQIGKAEPLFTFEDLFPLTGVVVEADAVAVSPDGATLAIGGGDGRLHLFDFTTRAPKLTIESHEQGVVSVAFSADSKTIATSGYDGKAKVWNSETGELAAVCEVEEGRGVHLDLAPDGKTLVSAGSDAVLWSTESGGELGNLDLGEPRAVRVMTVEFSPDGGQIATAEATTAFENAALIWSTQTRKLTATLKHELGVMALSFSPDGRLLATGSLDAKARIWRAADGELLQTIEQEEMNSVDQVAWRPDGKVLAVVSEGTIRFWGQPSAIESAEDPAGNGDSTEASEEARRASEPPVDSAANSDPRETTPADLATPATIEMMSEIIDLPSFPRIQGGDYQITEPAEISYLAPVPLPEARDFYRQRLTADGWTEQKQNIAQLDTDESWLREFEKGGFFLRLFLNTLGSPAGDQLITVELLHMGNVDTRKLPVPPDSTRTYQTASMSSFTTAADPDTVVETCRKLFGKLGWTERDPEDSSFRKLTLVQNAVRLQVDIRQSGPTTSVSYDVFVLKD